MSLSSSSVPPGGRPTVSSGWRWLSLVLLLVVFVGLPLGAALGFAWVEWQQPGLAQTAPPNWVTPQSVRATTSDGVLVKARVSIDAGDDDTRRLLESRFQDVGAVLQSSVAGLSRRHLAGGQGLQRLGDDMTDRVNEFLEGEQVAPVKAVAIQDFLITPP